ncbi:MAG: endopeptidase La [Mollicutes bacterium]|nr:endopeptidase La [Mollicutes bacterium]
MNIEKIPVLILKGIVLFPYSEIKIDFVKDIDKQLISLAEKDYDDEILLVPVLDPLDSQINLEKLPNIGVLGKINLKMDLQNNILRVAIKGTNRVKAAEYFQEENMIRADIKNTTQFAITPKDEMILIRKLNHEFITYIENNHELSNSIVSEIEESTNISRSTDLVSSYLTTSYERKIEYLVTINPYKRLLMLLEDIKKEKQLQDIDNQIEGEVQKQLTKSQQEYVLREKMRIIKEQLGELNAKDTDTDELRKRLESGNYPERIVKRLKKEIKKYEVLPQNSPEMANIRTYIEWLLDLPWIKITQDNKNLEKTRKVLDRSHYGLDNIKTRIIEFLAVRQMKSATKSPIICLAGPPGVGKTSLAKSIANSLNRRFVKISLGGVNDEAEIIGHRRAYVGSNPGRIIAGIKKAGTANPVFLIDEIDKMTKDYKGDPASALLEVLDKEQNSTFYDNFIEEEYDLSKVLFILTANNVYDIPYALRDRLEIIELSGYTEYEKLDIAKRYILPKELLEHGLTKDVISLSDKVIFEIINYYTREAGVREVERLIATICRKVVTKKLKEKKDKYIITLKNIEEYLGKRKYFYSEEEKESKVGVANGLVYTQFGGDASAIEVILYKGKGQLVLTGRLGEVIKESANIALSYIKANYQAFNIDYSLFEQNDIHIHFPEGSIMKEGPSAGITITTALISAFTNKVIDSSYGFTGEMTLRGQVIPIGGLKEKTMGAHRSGIKKVFLPSKNKRDIDDVPQEIKNNLEFIFVDNYMEIAKVLKFSK